jgi:phosphate transport system substrate-binding protein
MLYIYKYEEKEMKKYAVIVVLTLFAVFVYTGCKEADDDDFDTFKKSTIIEGLTVNNYPKVDGSTSAAPLNTIIACKLFGIGYKWVSDYRNLRSVEPNLNKNDTKKFWQLIKSSQTHESFVNLIDKEADLILSARKMSSDEKTHAAAAGVSLIETPIALDGFIFIVHPSNPVNSLTVAQIQDIYMGNITHWNEVGGGNYEMMPYIREANSGSQELMETLVMKDFDIADLPVSRWELVAFSMTGAFEVVLGNRDAICFTLYYYREQIATGINIKTIAIDGIYPGRETIGGRSYPYVPEVYAVIRSGLDTSSMAYKLYEWLQTEAGKQVINESGYVPY